MGKRIQPQAKQIILRVIQFCEEEKKNGLLAPYNQAIKRACLATGLSKYIILKIKNEAHAVIIDRNVDGYASENDEEILGSDMPVAPGTSAVLLNQNNTNELPVSGSEPASALETVLVKMEPDEDIQEGPTHGVNRDVKLEYDSDPDYEAKTQQNEVGQPTTVVLKCEFECTDDPLMPSFKQEELPQDGAFGTSKRKNENRDKENSSKKKRNVPGVKQTSGTGVGRYECHICHKKLSSTSKLKAHITLHTDEKPFPCSICQNKYSYKKGLQRHLKTHTDRRYQCSICQQRFTENSKLNRHIKSHTGEKQFNCEICERKFIRNEELRIHIRTHTGEKPFECSTCRAKFRQKITLQKHLRTHTGEKTHECSVCHSWFACSSSLQVHSRTHTGEKPYACSVCPKRFAQSIHLIRHARTHAAPGRLFECDICRSTYPEKHQLRAHIKTHTEKS